VIAACLKRLLEAPRVGQNNLPSTAIVTVRQQERDLIVHLLHYIHQRRGRGLDIIEDVISLHKVEMEIRVDRQPREVRLVPEMQLVDWDWEDGYVHLRVPRVNGYQMVQIEEAL
jgi:hypothetical protein